VEGVEGAEGVEGVEEAEVRPWQPSLLDHEVEVGGVELLRPPACQDREEAGVAGVAYRSNGRRAWKLRFSGMAEE
jgi:hypothetical protein